MSNIFLVYTTNVTYYPYRPLEPEKLSVRRGYSMHRKSYFIHSVRDQEFNECFCMYCGSSTFEIIKP